MSFSIANRLSLLAEIITIILFLYGLYGEKFRIDYKEIVLIAIHIIFMQSIDSGYLPRQANAVIYVIFAVYCFWRFGNNIKKIIVNISLCIVFLVVLQMSVFSLVYIIAGQGMGEEYRTLLTNVIMFSLCFSLKKKIELRKIAHYFQRDDIIIRTLLVIGVGILIAYIYVEQEDKGLYFGEYFLLSVVVLVMCIMTVSWQSYKINAREKELELQTYKLYEASYTHLITEIRLKQHEFNNHINAIYSQHLVCKTYDELVERQREYCESIIYDNRYEKLLKTGNSVLIGFLYGKFMEAESRKIVVEYDVRWTGFNIKLPIYKVIELVGNLLNNAMDALEKTDNKRLYVSIVEEKEYISVCVQNVYKEVSTKQIAEMFQKGYSSKGENRGLGLYSLKKMGKEYGFEIICSNILRSDEKWISFSVNLEKSV